MDLESVIATIASLVAIYAFAKNDTSLFLLLKKNFFDTNLPQYFFVGSEKTLKHKGVG
jgi:hypothetical protein